MTDQNAYPERHYIKKWQIGKREVWLAILGLTVFNFGASTCWASPRSPRVAELLTPGIASNLALSDIPANEWIKLYQPLQLDWRRQGHSGMAFDSRRRRLILFGSDTHNRNWDNRVHIFDLTTRRWSSPLPEYGKETYRKDAQGNLIAGPEDQPIPVAMHTFDSLVYDPKLDSLIVVGQPAHNPAIRSIKGIRTNPAWRFDLATKSWHLFPNDSSNPPSLFGGSLAYDRKRDTLVAYKHGIWEMGPDRTTWQKTTRESHHEIHHNMEFDTKHGYLVVFGDYSKTNTVWIYHPNPVPGMAGSWEQRSPTGSAPPPGETLPVAYDEDNGLFLLAADESYKKKKNLRGPAQTYIYDSSKNHYYHLPKAKLPVLGMNYMMTYDTTEKVFLLVTGDWKVTPTVWALRLNPALLQ
jgi:hypothetical protein